MKIYNHDILTCTHEQVSGNFLYSGRALGLTQPDDLIQLHPALKSEWGAITTHYQQVGLVHSLHPIWDVDLERLTQYPGQDISVFYFGDTGSQTSRIAEIFRYIDARRAAIVNQINSKNFFMQRAQALGVSTPPTVCVESKTTWMLESLSFPYPVYLKPAVSVDGMGIVRCQDAAQLTHAVQQLDATTAFQVQAEVKAVAFLNLQYCGTPQGHTRIAASEQILADCTHQGNRYPTPYQPWEVVEPMAAWMVQQGMADLFAFDVAVCLEEGQPRYYAIECNPRFNGASYPTGIAKKLNIPSWSAETFQTQWRALQQVNLDHLAFNPERGVGIIVVNWGTILVGKLVVLLAGTVEQQAELRSWLKERL